MKEEFDMQLTGKQDAGVTLQISKDCLEMLHVMIKHADSMTAKGVDFSKENLSVLNKALPQITEKTELTEFEMEESIFHTLYKLINAHYANRENLPENFSVESISDLKTSADSIFHEFKEHNVSSEDQELIRNLIDKHRGTLEELHKR